MKPEILLWDAIEARLRDVDLVGRMEEAFVAYSQGRCVIPPVGELAFSEPPGDVHIKYGYARGGADYVVKIASGFYENPALGLPSSQGLMLLFNQATGQLRSILLDEGRLTDARTGAAGAVAAKHLAPTRVDRIGIVGSGTQARYQAEYLRQVTRCREVRVWGRHADRASACALELAEMGYQAAALTHLQELVESSQIIVTTTPAREALVRSEWVMDGTHITGVGSDTPEKIELDPLLVSRARVVVDSLEQCRSRGELYQAVSAGVLSHDVADELGAVIDGQVVGRQTETEITIADLTGVAAQDLFAASAVVDSVR